MESCDANILTPRRKSSIAVLPPRDPGRLTVHFCWSRFGTPPGLRARGLHDARTESPLSRIRKNGGVVNDRKFPPVYSPFTRITVTALPGNVWRMADSPALMQSVTGTTLGGLASEFSSVGLSEASTFILGGLLSGGVRRAFIGRESRTRQVSEPGCAGVLLGPGTVDGSQRQIQRRGVVQRPGVAAAIVTESEDGGEFQDDVGTG